MMMARSVVDPIHVYDGVALAMALLLPSLLFLPLLLLLLQVTVDGPSLITMPGTLAHFYKQIGDRLTWHRLHTLPLCLCMTGNAATAV
jgi:hypothetical protein